ncbi:MAG TPA: nucleoside/nucleotide kinase family protein [Rugosimonospora sp.]
MATSHPTVLAGARSAIEPLLAAGHGRILVGIAGPPAAGKSTLAATLASDLCASLGEGGAVAVPMDGFHLSNAQLARLGLADRKGAPETFDAWGFAALLHRLRRPAAGEVVYAPEYSRVLHESIGGAIPVPAATRVLVVEGNYLLLPSPPWTLARRQLDLVLYLEAATPVRVDALLRRQRARGLAAAAAQDWVYRSDEANAALIGTTKRYADVVLTRP